MKTIDEQLNIINDTKNGIAQVLNSKGVEVTAETKFADYPDKVAQLMGNTEVDASVSAALTEVTAEYLEQVNAVKAQADGLEESKLDVSVAEATYQPKGEYLTQHQDISGKLDASVAEATYQPKGEYLTQHQDISGKLDVSVAAETYATKQEVNGAGYLTQHQDISGKLDASVAEATYQPKGNYLTEHQDISGKLDASVAAETYQPKGNYLTEHQDISGKLDASVAEATYQPKGAYLTEHQDISGKLDASVAEATYQPKGAYLTEHQSLADYALKSELPLVPTNVSAFTNDAGYLTSHQDISNLLDVSTAAATYATKQEIQGLGAETVADTIVYGESVDTTSTPQEMTSIVLKFNNSDMAPSDYVESFNSIKDSVIRIPMSTVSWYDQENDTTVYLKLKYNDEEEAWYVNPEGCPYDASAAAEPGNEGYTVFYDALPISQWFDRTQEWTPQYYNTHYKANFTAEFEVLTEGNYAYQLTITFDHKRNIICGTSSTWFTEWRSQSVQRILSRELTMKQYVDGVAETKVSSSALSNYDTKTEVANTYVKKADNIHSSQTGYLYHRNMGGMKITFNGFEYSQTQDRPDYAMWNGSSQTLLLNTPEWIIMATGYQIIIRNATNENEEYTYSRETYGMSGNRGPDVRVRKLPKTFTITVPTWTGYNDMFRFYLDVPYDEYTEIKADDLAASHSSDVSTLNAAISAKLDSSTAAATYATKSELTADSIYEQTTAETAVFNGTPTYEPEWNSGDAGQATGIVIGFSSDFNDYDLKFMGSVGMASDPYIRISNGYFDIYAQDVMEGTETVVVHTTDFTTTTDNGVTTVTANFGSAVDFSNTYGMFSQNMNNVSLFKTLNSTTVTVKQKIAQLEALIATLHPQS